MRRALPSIAVALGLAALLAAGVIASPEDPPRRSRSGGGPLAVMREKPTELEAPVERFDEQHVSPSPPLQPVDEFAPTRPKGPSRAVGRPWAGRLVNGVQLPAWGVGFVTFDSATRVSPSRGWRRWGTEANVARTMKVLSDFRAAHPDGPRLAVGDLSRPYGGPFGRKYGGLGHASHQNGVDVDVYYPRRDRAEVPPAKPSEVDRKLAQELVDRFVLAGAQMTFVGPSLHLRGPRAIVKPLVHHDDHVHVRWPAR